MDELEKEGIALVKQYGFVLRMNPQLRNFLSKVAFRMGWTQLHEML